MRKAPAATQLTILALCVIFLAACENQHQAPELPPELAQGDPIATPFDRRPSALNRDEFQAALIEHAPDDVDLVPGSNLVMVYMLIDTEGNVRRTVVSGSSGYSSLDQAAETVARVLRFSPGQLDGEPVPVWLELPIIFGLEDD